MRRVGCGALGLGLGLGLAACGPVVSEVAEPGVEAEAWVLPAELRGLGVAIDRAWVEATTVWLIAEHRSDTYPCRPGPDGSLDMILRDALAVRRVLRGTVALAEIDVDATALVGAGYPPGLVAGRSYLVMLRPGPETAVRLADPRGSFSLHERLDRAEIVAIVDLSQSADERASEAVLASRSGTRDGVRFDPQRWAAARDAAQVGDEEAAIGRFIAAELLARPGATLAELRAWLGAPDVHQRGEDALLLRYWLARPRYERPEDGAVYGQVELHLRRDALVEGSVRWFRWRVSADGSSSSSELAAEGLRERGLATAVLQRREVSSTSAGR